MKINQVTNQLHHSYFLGRYALFLDLHWLQIQWRQLFESINVKIWLVRHHSDWSRYKIAGTIASDIQVTVQEETIET